MPATTRRSLLLSALSAATLIDIVQARSAMAAKAPFRYLSSADALEIEAISAQIIPSDETPGAKEAGCIHFIDLALHTFDREKRELYRTGLAETQTKREELFPASQSIAALESTQAVALLRDIDRTDFFALLRTHTVMGFLAAPEWGGNRASVGWSHIGLERKMAFQPPFGFYDGEPK